MGCGSPGFAPYLKSALAQMAELRFIKLRKRPIALVATQNVELAAVAREADVSKLFFIEIIERTKGLSSIAPFYEVPA